MHFLLHLHQVGLTPGTIVHKMAALSFTAKTVGFLEPCVDFRIHRAHRVGCEVPQGLRIGTGLFLQRCYASYMRFYSIFAILIVKWPCLEPPFVSIF